MKKISTKIFLIFIAINFHHCSKSNDDKALAKYTGGQLTKSELIARIGNNRFNKIIASDSYLRLSMILYIKRLSLIIMKTCLIIRKLLMIFIESQMIKN